MAVTGKIDRKYMAHYIDAGSLCGGLTPKYERLGKDLEEYNVELNPDTETSKNILGESTFKHNGYEVSSDADPFYADTTSDLFTALQKIVDGRLKDDNLKTKAVEVHLWTEATAGKYEAYQQDCYVVPTSYGGDTSGYQIPYTRRARQMAKVINTKIDDGILIFTFTNNEDEVFSSFKLNPTDINVAARAEELEEYFEQLKDSIQKVTSGKEMAELNKQIEDKINYLLGYEASKDLFKEPITATTVFGNGQVFAYIVLDKIAEAIAPEIEKRKKKMQAAVNKYTEKYAK